ncbi:MAG TPA: hypothetical protein VFQ35_24490 [Polyangiaceae bacterium]|nr:hypothetical protein [Polyangiaceae bacterium]
MTPVALAVVLLTLAASACTAKSPPAPSAQTPSSPPPTSARQPPTQPGLPPEVAQLAQRTREHAVVLPTCAHVVENWPAEDLPQVALLGDAIVYDEKAVGSARAILASGKLQRVDELFEKLKARREAWKATHPHEEHPGTIAFLFDRKAPMAVVKSVFQTAAFSGYPHLSFLVRKADAEERLARVLASAHVPAPLTALGNPSPKDPFRLGITQSQGQLSIEWHYGTEGLNEPLPRLVSQPELGEQIRSEWERYGGHRSATDASFDQATLRVEDSSDFETMIRLLDALYTPLRDLRVGEYDVKVPAFDVTLEVN